MAVAQGYGKTVTSGSVFAYDVGDTRNSYIGKPTTNLLTTLNKSNVDTSLFMIAPGQEVKNVPGIGNTTVHYVDVYNDYNGGSGNCCPAPMQFGDFTVTPSTEYTYQIIYRTTTGYAHPNYMYHYEYNGGTYVTEYGLWNGSRQTDLGDGWKHAWGTFTSNASTNRFICYLFHYEYGTQNRIEVAGVMLTQGNAILPPNQFIPVNTTRSATQGLLPLVGNSGIDLSNVSFDSNAQMTFDGTDDAGIVSNFALSTNYSYEGVFYIDPSDSGYSGFFSNMNSPSGISGTGNGWLLRIEPGGALQLYVKNNSSTYNLPINVAGFRATYAGQKLHVVYKCSSNYNAIHINGELFAEHTGYSTGILPIDSQLLFGAYDWGIVGQRYYLKGYAYLVKAYNRALTAAEVNQNYRHYKTRFNLS